MSYDVAIGAGHGGYGVTPGKRSPAGEYEWSFNNIATVACINHLEANGVSTYRLDDRTGRTDVSLAERVRRANNSGAKVLTSIHANANTGVWSAGWGGTETYIPSGNNSGSRRLANCVHPKLVNAMRLQNRGIKTANFYIIWNTRMPSILVETGFMDSTIDIVRLRNKTVMRNAGVAIAKGIMEYLGVRGNKTAPSKPSKTSPSKPSPSKKLFRVRKSWSNSKSQIGAYSTLEAAKKVAQKKSGYKVYNDGGKQVWPKAQMYRVRKKWSDSKSQKGAFKDLEGAKKLADKNPGYKVYDANGKQVYAGKKQADSLYRVRKKWSDSKSQKGAFKSLASAKEEADKNSGYKVYNGAGKVVYTPSKKSKEEKTDNLYRVRKKWSDVKGQKGAFKTLDAAKELADKNSGYKVYNGKGKLVYTPSKKSETKSDNLYRVRKSWSDVKTQKGAFKSLDSAKEEADKHSGYKVFDENGKSVYTPKKTSVKTDDLYRIRKSWNDAKSQKGAFKSLDSAKEVANQYGYDVFNSSGKSVYKGDTSKAKTPAPKEEPKPKLEGDHSGHTSIIGKMETDSKKMKAFLKSVNPNFKDTDEVADAFIAMGKKYGVRGDIAFCQSIIETGWFRFEGGTAVTPDQHNYCGMGVTSLGKKGNSFDTVEDGVEAQIQHLFGYASTKDIPSDRILSPRLQYVTRGIAPHWEDLSMRWAMNENYGKHILEMYDKMSAFSIKDDKGEKPSKPDDESKEESSKDKNGEEVNVGLLNKVLDLAFSFFTKKKK